MRRSLTPSGEIFLPIVEYFLARSNFFQACQALTGFVIEYGQFVNLHLVLGAIIHALAEERLLESMKRMYEISAKLPQVVLEVPVVMSVLQAFVSPLSFLRDILICSDQ